MKYYKILENGVEMDDIWLIKMYDYEFSEKLAREEDNFLEDFITKTFWYNGKKYVIQPANEAIAEAIANARTYEEAYAIAEQYKFSILKELKEKELKK